MLACLKFFPMEKHLALPKWRHLKAKGEGARLGQVAGQRRLFLPLLMYGNLAP